MHRPATGTVPTTATIAVRTGGEPTSPTGARRRDLSPATCPRSTSSTAATSSVDEGEFVGIIGPNGAGKSTLLKALFGLCSVRVGHVTLARRRHHRAQGPRAGRRGRRLRAPDAATCSRALTVSENLEMGCFLDAVAVPRALRVRHRPVPAAGRAARPAGRLAVGWRAPDGGHGPGPDDGPDGAAARRAVGRAVAGAAGRGVRALPADQPGRAWRS